MQPEIRSFVLLLQLVEPLSPHLTVRILRRMRTVPKWNVFGHGKCEFSANQERRNEGANFWQGKVQNSSPILRCKFLARKSVKLTANFSATMVTSLPSISLSLSVSLSLSLSLTERTSRTISFSISNSFWY